MSAFMPGLQLSELFFIEAVRPLLAHQFPKLRYAAGLLSAGSDVLGFDTERSMDHDWGPRLLLFLEPADETQKQAIDTCLRIMLPGEIQGYSTHFGQMVGGTTRWMEPAIPGEPINHSIRITTLPDFLSHTLGVTGVDALTPIDWMLFSEQSLLEVTAGKIFHDDAGNVSHARSQLAYFPHEIWLQRMAAQWMRISQLEPFVGRTGELGDNRGSALIAADLVRDLMHLAFLIEQQYAPYPKWMGIAFDRLACANALGPILDAVIAGHNWQVREQRLSMAYQMLAAMHNHLGITGRLPETVSPFHNRPFTVIHGEVFAQAIRNVITDDGVQKLPAFIGGVDQWIDSTDLLTQSARRQAMRALYEQTN